MNTIDDPGTDVRAELAALARDEVLEAVATLMEEVHDVDFHRHDGMAGLSWTDHLSLDELTSDGLHLADRLLTTAADTRAAIVAALARRDWLTGGRPLRCAGCGDDIDPTTEAWRVCRALAEHDVCHDDDTTVEDQNRAWALDEDEEDAYCQDHTRTGGPRDGDTIAATYPDGSTATGVWEFGPDGSGRAATSSHRFGDPVPADLVLEFLDLTTAVSVRVVWAAGPTDHPGPATTADESK